MISVVLPVYNQEKYIALAIESILAQSFTNLELLIRDDGSTDNSAAIIKNYAAKDQRIMATYATNQGRANATNALVAQAKGSYCALVDADDVMLPGRLEKQIAYLKANPQVAACSCHSQYIDKNGKALGALTYPFLKNEAASITATEQHQIVLCSFTGLLIRTKAYITSGGLDTRFWPADDFEFVNRLVQQGFVVVILQEILMQYRVHSLSATGKDLEHIYYKGQYARTCFYLRLKNAPEPSFNDYLLEKEKQSPKKRRKLKQHIRSIDLFQHAGFALYQKKYVQFVWLAAKASWLSPNFLLSKLNKLKLSLKPSGKP